MRFAPKLGSLVSDDTTHTAADQVADVSNMRRRLGSWETIYGWETLIGDLLGGVCRSAFPWTDAAAIINIAFGTHATLEVFQGGELFDITPTLEMPAIVLTNPFTVTDASAVVTVNHPGHGLTTGDGINISGAANVGRIQPDGDYTVTVLDEDSYTITHGSVADLAMTLGNNPLTVTNGSPTVTVTDTAFKIADGTTVTISGAAAVGGITPNGSFVIANIDANSYRYQFTSNATSGATGGGASVVVTVPSMGGGQVTIKPLLAFAAGNIDGTGSAGFGTGGYGVGGYGEPSDTDYFPRTWSLSAFGANLIANPRGGTIYAWTNDTGTPAAPLTNAPREVTYTLVTAQDVVMALGCNEEVSGVFNHLCIRHSSIRNNTEWNTDQDTTAREYILPGGGRIVGGRLMGAYVLVWTADGLYIGTYIGSLEQPYRFDPVPGKGGLIGPNAAVVVGSTAYWVSPDRQFYAYTLGGAITPIPCPIRTAFAENLADSQGDKVVASSVGEHEEVRFDYPDRRDGNKVENSRYLLLKVSGQDAGEWSRGIMARTAMVDAGPTSYPVGTTYEGNIYYHEKGESADGGVIPNHIQTADMMLSEDSSMLINEMRPDFQGQRGVVSVTVIVRDEPQGTQTTKGPYTASPGARKVDMRATGRYATLRYESNYRFRAGESVFDIRKAGNR